MPLSKYGLRAILVLLFVNTSSCRTSHYNYSAEEHEKHQAKLSQIVPIAFGGSSQVFQILNGNILRKTSGERNPVEYHLLQLLSDIPTFVRYYGTFEANGYHYYEMEALSPEYPTTLIKRLSSYEAASMIQDILRSLLIMTESNITHNDLGMLNILTRQSIGIRPTSVILDYGEASFTKSDSDIQRIAAELETYSNEYVFQTQARDSSETIRRAIPLASQDLRVLHYAHQLVSLSKKDNISSSEKRSEALEELLVAFAPIVGRMRVTDSNARKNDFLQGKLIFLVSHLRQEFTSANEFLMQMYEICNLLTPLKLSENNSLESLFVRNFSKEEAETCQTLLAFVRKSYQRTHIRKSKSSYAISIDEDLLESLLAEVRIGVKEKPIPNMPLPLREEIGEYLIIMKRVIVYSASSSSLDLSMMNTDIEQQSAPRLPEYGLSSTPQLRHGHRAYGNLKKSHSYDEFVLENFPRSISSRSEKNDDIRLDIHSTKVKKHFSDLVQGNNPFKSSGSFFSSVLEHSLTSSFLMSKYKEVFLTDFLAKVKEFTYPKKGKTIHEHNQLWLAYEEPWSLLQIIADVAVFCNRSRSLDIQEHCIRVIEYSQSPSKSLATAAFSLHQKVEVLLIPLNKIIKAEGEIIDIITQIEEIILLIKSEYDALFVEESKHLENIERDINKYIVSTKNIIIPTHITVKKDSTFSYMREYHEHVFGLCGSFLWIHNSRELECINNSKYAFIKHYSSNEYAASNEYKFCDKLMRHIMYRSLSDTEVIGSHRADLFEYQKLFALPSTHKSFIRTKHIDATANAIFEINGASVNTDNTAISGAANDSPILESNRIMRLEETLDRSLIKPYINNFLSYHCYNTFTHYTQYTTIIIKHWNQIAYLHLDYAIMMKYPEIEPRELLYKKVIANMILIHEVVLELSMILKMNYPDSLDTLLWVNSNSDVRNLKNLYTILASYTNALDEYKKKYIIGKLRIDRPELESALPHSIKGCDIEKEVYAFSKELPSHLNILYSNFVNIMNTQSLSAPLQIKVE